MQNRDIKKPGVFIKLLSIKFKRIYNSKMSLRRKQLVKEVWNAFEVSPSSYF